MAITIKKQRRARTEAISLRVDPRTKFIIEFLAREWNSTSTSAIERCILQMAHNVEIGRTYTSAGLPLPGKTWRDFWDTEEGVRQIRIIADENTTKTFEEEELLEFIKWHIEFFSNYNRIDVLDKARVSVLWPKIDEYAAEWLDKEDHDIFGVSDIWEAGKKMAKTLKEAGITPPKWPREDTEPPVAILTREEESDQIPF